MYILKHHTVKLEPVGSQRGLGLEVEEAGAGVVLVPLAGVVEV